MGKATGGGINIRLPYALSSSEGMHLYVLLSLETKSAITCDVSAQGAH